MLRFERQGACIEVKVTTSDGVCIFNQSAAADQPSYVATILNEAMQHETRIMEGIISSRYHDRIRQLQDKLREYEGRSKPKDVLYPPIEVAGYLVGNLKPE